MFAHNFEHLDRLTEQGYLRKVISPCGELVLYNYSDKTTFEKKWNRHTKSARGTIYNINTGKIVARSFNKFFNFGELAVSKQRNLLNKTEFEVYEKCDGSLVNLWYYNRQWNTSTRGSFTSEQAIKAKEMLSKYDISRLNEDYTYQVEIVYPENKIIVNYGDKEALVLLNAKHNQTGEDLTREDLIFTHQLTGMEIAQKLHFKKISELIEKQDELPASEEGYVVRFQNGERVKFKSKKYLDLARILSHCSPLTFWAKMENGLIDTDFLQSIPEEFREEQEEIVRKLELTHVKKLSQIMGDFLELKNTLQLEDFPNNSEKKKQIGLYSKENKVRNLNVMFSIIDNNMEDVHNYIHKAIKPVGNVIREI